jgi:6-phosphogluconolactonase
MKLAKYAGWMLGLLPLLGGCKGFWDNPSNSGGGGGGGNTSSSGAFYVLNTGATGSAPQIIGGVITSGKFGNISGSPWTLSNSPFAMAVSPNGSFLYVSTIGGVNVFPISTSGALGTPVGVSQDPALAIQIDTSGNWLIEAVQAAAGSVTMAAVPISSSSGGSNGTETSSTYPVNGAVTPGKIAVSPDDKYVFIALGTGGTLALPFNAAAGAGISPFAASGTVIPVRNAGGSVLSVAVDPGGHLVFVGESLASANGKSGGLRAFNYSSLGTSSITQAAGSPVDSGGTAPNAIFPKPSGNFVYVANGTGLSSAGNLASFSISASGSTYTIAAAGTVAAGAQPVSLAEDSTGTYLFAVNSGGNPYLNSYTFDATTAGKLDPQVTVNTGASPLAIVAP